MSNPVISSLLIDRIRKWKLNYVFISYRFLIHHLYANTETVDSYSIGIFHTPWSFNQAELWFWQPEKHLSIS